MGKRHGEGIQVWQDGTVYIGEWQNDKINGEGTTHVLIIYRQVLAPQRRHVRGRFHKQQK